ncbi:MAG: CopG family antitoxin [candidate division KSB1 bacterium]|nr:CopG family antitoxin [candidate division KSB1 bacterium]
MKLDKFEKDIEDNISEYKPVSAKSKKKIDSIIRKSKEKKSINLRINNYDLELLKQKAEQEGIPYQTLISSILHKYLTDQLIEQKDIIKSVQILKYGS